MAQKREISATSEKLKGCNMYRFLYPLQVDGKCAGFRSLPRATALRRSWSRKSLMSALRQAASQAQRRAGTDMWKMMSSELKVLGGAIRPEGAESQPPDSGEPLGVEQENIIIRVWAFEAQYRCWHRPTLSRRAGRGWTPPAWTSWSPSWCPTGPTGLQPRSWRSGREGP